MIKSRPIQADPSWVPARLIQLRYRGSCASCGATLPVGANARWDPEAKTVRCEACPPVASDAGDTDYFATAVPKPEPGVAGASATAEYERRHRRREERVLDCHPRVGRAVLALRGDPWSTRAWNIGARGEQRVGARLDRLTECGAAVLHDRRIPGSSANIDHIVIAPSGVWIVDAKRYRGRIEHRDGRLFVANRDRSKLVAGMAKQVAVVDHALDTSNITVRPVLCFTGSDWPAFMKPFTVDDVLVTWRGALVDTIRRARDEFVSVSEVCARIAAQLPGARAQS